MKRNISLLFIAIGFSLFSIQCKKNCGSPNINEDCSLVLCTKEFRSISVQIKDAQGNPFVFDKTETKLNGTVIHSETQASDPTLGNCTIVDDSDMQDLGTNQQQTVSFLVYKNNQVVSTATFVVSADCCHVDKVSGNSEIIISF